MDLVIKLNLHIFSLFSVLSIVESRKLPSAVEVEPEIDGEQFIKKISNGESTAEFEWQKEYWHHNSKPLKHLSRRSWPSPVKEINIIKCECPPHDECSLNYKLNLAALDIMKHQGEITEEDADGIRELNAEETSIHSPRKRRFNDELVTDDDCCCPPRSMMMPTIITEKRFNETIKRISENMK